MEGKITLTSVEALEPGPTGETTLWDTELKGFGVRVRSGGTRTYLVQYRAGRGRNAPLRKFTIGKHGSPWTAETARREAKVRLGNIAEGKDPAAIRAAEKAIPTVSWVAAQFLDEYAESKLKPRSIGDYRKLIDSVIVPRLGTLRADLITRAEIARFHANLKKTPRKANYALAVLSKMLSWAMTRGYRPDGLNPCRGIPKNKERQHERFLSTEELARLGVIIREAEDRANLQAASNETLQDLRRQKHNARIRGDREGVVAFTARINEIRTQIEAAGEPVSPSAISAIRLLIFTGARLTEILTAEWSWVDLERGTLRLPDSKTGAKTIHLNAPARALLEAIPKTEGNPYVVTGFKPGTHLVNLEKPWQAIRKAAGMEDVRLHDLRHSFASVGAAGGLSLPLVGALLGHTQPATTARYAHLSADPVRDAAEMIGDRLAAALAGNIDIGRGPKANPESPAVPEAIPATG